MLFLYNIAPKQIEIESEERALHYSEYGDKERVLANSGLWAIEQEIQRFADNYAPYNKCYQSLLFLLKVREIAENDIADAVRMHDKSRAEYQSQLDAGVQRLLAELTIRRDGFVEKALNGYSTEMETSKKEAYTPIAKTELVKLEEELTSALETAVGYSMQAEAADKAKEKTYALCLLRTCADERSSRYAYFADGGTNEAEKEGCSMGFAYHLRCDRSSWCI